MKYSKRCEKVAYNFEQEAWEYVIHYRRQSKSWTQPYLCKCGKYHTTGKHFNADKVPSWVKQLANDKQRLTKSLPDIVLPLRKQKEAISNLPPWEPLWKLVVRKLLNNVKA